MTEMGNLNRQVISITHLPQIASMGTHHYKVLKEETEEGTLSHMEGTQRAAAHEEIAQMLSGSDITPAAWQMLRSCSINTSNTNKIMKKINMIMMGLMLGHRPSMPTGFGPETG